MTSNVQLALLKRKISMYSEHQIMMNTPAKNENAIKRVHLFYLAEKE